MCTASSETEELVLETGKWWQGMQDSENGWGEPCALPKDSRRLGGTSTSLAAVPIPPPAGRCGLEKLNAFLWFQSESLLERVVSIMRKIVSWRIAARTRRLHQERN